MIILQTSDFDPDGRLRIRSRGTICIFYAPWCPHCKMLVKQWPNLSKLTSVQLAWMDCDDQKVPFVSMYPTIAYFDASGKPTYYPNTRPRDLEHVAWFTKCLALGSFWPIATTVMEPYNSSADNLRQTSGIKMVLLYRPASLYLKPVYEQASSIAKGIPWCAVNCEMYPEDQLRKWKISTLPCVRLAHKGAKLAEVTGHITLQALLGMVYNTRVAR